MKRARSAVTSAAGSAAAAASTSSAAASAVARDASGALVFPDAPSFRPNLTPQQILQAGAFGGGYFRTIHSGVTKKSYEGAWREFPAQWYEGLDIPTQVASAVYHPERNKYGVKCGLGLLEWESSGWIASQDPFGWFQWYCRYFLGRRTDDDPRQISRWEKCAGVKGRWKANLVAKIVRSNAKFDDPSISPVVRQTLLHWGYELTEADYEKEAKRYRQTGKAPYIPAVAPSSVASGGGAADEDGEEGGDAPNASVGGNSSKPQRGAKRQKRAASKDK